MPDRALNVLVPVRSKGRYVHWAALESDPWDRPAFGRFKPDWPICGTTAWTEDATADVTCGKCQRIARCRICGRPATRRQDSYGKRHYVCEDHRTCRVCGQPIDAVTDRDGHLDPHDRRCPDSPKETTHA